MQHQPGGRLLVLREITQLKEVQRELERLATTDTLTGAYNRRHFFKLAESAESEVERCRRHQLQLALILMDVDHFKRVNDRYGHPAGDRVLVAAAEACARDTLEDLLRRADQALYAAKAGGRNRVDAGAAALPPAP